MRCSRLKYLLLGLKSKYYQVLLLDEKGDGVEGSTVGSGPNLQPSPYLFLACATSFGDHCFGFACRHADACSAFFRWRVADS